VTDIKEVLAKSVLFKDLSDAELGQVLPLCHEKSYAAGFSVISEGDAAKDLYIIAKGKVIVEMSLSVYPGMVHEALVETIPSEEPFGWSAVVGSMVSTMTARCAEATRVIAIDGEQLLSLFNGSPAIGFKVMEGLVEIVSARIKSVMRTAFA
jgi:CRP/FNR family cyclic AMP-dependent transcriptional regulator